MSSTSPRPYKEDAASTTGAASPLAAASETGAPAAGAAAPVHAGARAPAVGFIIATCFIDAVGFGIVIPVIPELIMGLSGQDVGGAAVWGGLATFVFALAQFFCSPAVGGLSDRFGRRPVLLLSLAALTVDYLLMGLAHALWVFFIARLIAGVCAATNSTANAYIADVVAPEKRAQAFGWIGAAFGAGFVAGPAIGGLLGELDPRAPFFVAAALAGVNLLYGSFVVPESLTKAKRRAFSWRRANPVGAFIEFARIKGLRALAAVFFLSSLSGFVYPAVWTYVAIAKFGWSEGQIGLSLAVFGLAFAFSQIVVVPWVLPRLGERTSIALALGVESAALVAMAFAPNAALVYAIILVTALTGIEGPALQKIMTNATPETQQGELQGGLAALGGLVLIITPLLYTQVFSAFAPSETSDGFPGAPFLVAAVFSGAAALLFLATSRASART